MNEIILAAQWESELMVRIQSHASSILTGVMSAVTMLGEELLLVAIIGYLYLCWDKKLGRAMSAGMLFALLGGEFLKNSIMRLRPYFADPGIQCLRAPAGSGDVMDIAVQGYSFPSLHSSNAVIMFGTPFPNLGKRWIKALFVALILLIGFSRVYLGAHYPTDVLAGWALGLMALLAVTFVLRSYSNWLVIFIVCALVALPGWFVCHTKDFFTAYGLMTGMFIAFHFDDKIVNFSNIPHSLRSVLRLILGLALFLGLCEGLKLPFSKEFLDDGSFAAHLVRAARYAISSFAIMGLYPMLFKHTDRFFKSKK